MANLTIQVDDELLEQATEVLGRYGIDVPTAIRLFLEQTVLDQALLFDPTDNPIYSEANIRHLKKVFEDVKANRNLVTHSLIDPE